MSAENLEYVGFWPRVGAVIIDTIVVLLLTAPLISWIYGADEQLDLNELLAMDPESQPTYLRGLLTAMITPKGPLDVLISWVLPAIAIVVLWLTRSATPGKMAIGARIVDATTGNAISIRQGIVRYLGYYVSSFPLCLGLVWVAFDPRKQGWHDKLAGTVVVRAKNRGPQPVNFNRS